MNTKRVLEIVLSFCIGWMIYSMLFMREGHSFLSMASLDSGGVGPTARAADARYEEEDEAYEDRMDEDLDGEEPEDDDYEEDDL
jgi:hypothetical protein